MEIEVEEIDEVIETTEVQIIGNPVSYKFYLLNLDYANDKFYAFAPEEWDVRIGTLVVVSTKYGVDVARVCGQAFNVVNDENAVEIIRLANEDDLLKVKNNEIKEREAGEIFKEKVKENKLDMKFILAHFLLEEPKVLFFFSADGRIDFRALVKDLVVIFKVRVELRQIGVRDETRFIGGLASCGRPFCCHAITDKMTGVTIKMAKDQNLSLNSSRISGHCGRLLCCLSYEHEHYAIENKRMPPQGTKLDYEGATFVVKEVNQITSTISLLGEDGRTITFPPARFKKENEIWKII